MYTTCSELAIFTYWICNSMNNLLSYCGLVDARISASEKDLPVQVQQRLIGTFKLTLTEVLKSWAWDYYNQFFAICNKNCTNTAKTKLLWELSSELTGLLSHKGSEKKISKLKDFFFKLMWLVQYRGHTVRISRKYVVVLEISLSQDFKTTFKYLSVIIN